MRIVKHRIEGPVQSGKTTDLTGLVRLWARANTRCLVVLPTKDMADYYRRKHCGQETENIRITDAVSAFDGLVLKADQYGAIFIDGEEHFPEWIKREGSFADILAARYRFIPDGFLRIVSTHLTDTPE